MNKRIIALLLCCVFCLTALFSGCGEVAQNDNEQGSVIDDDLGTLATDKKENETMSKFSKELRDAVSPEVLALAEKGELGYEQINSYAEYQLYLLQGLEGVVSERTTLSPGRTADIKIDKIFDTDLMSLYNVDYYVFEESKENIDNAAYFNEYFSTQGKADFGVMVYYMVPGKVKTAAEAVGKVVHTKSFTQNLIDLGYVINYIDYNKSMYDDGNTTLLKFDLTVDKVVNIVSYNNQLCFIYDSTSSLKNIVVLSNNVLINVVFNETLDSTILKTQLSTAVTDCFSVDTIDKATAQFNEITNVGTISTAN